VAENAWTSLIPATADAGIANIIKILASISTRVNVLIILFFIFYLSFLKTVYNVCQIRSRDGTVNELIYAAILLCLLDLFGNIFFCVLIHNENDLTSRILFFDSAWKCG
jgi:hypothetical protein